MYILLSFACVNITERTHRYSGVIAHTRFDVNNISVNISVKKVVVDTEEELLVKIALGSVCFMHRVHHNEYTRQKSGNFNSNRNVDMGLTKIQAK
jgi:hypothetical protein